MADENEDQQEFLWVVSHDIKMKHFILELHCAEYLSSLEFMDHLADLVEQYKENPEELFDTVDAIEAQ